MLSTKRVRDRLKRNYKAGNISKIQTKNKAIELRHWQEADAYAQRANWT